MRMMPRQRMECNRLTLYPIFVVGSGSGWELPFHLDISFDIGRQFLLLMLVM